MHTFLRLTSAEQNLGHVIWSAEAEDAAAKSDKAAKQLLKFLQAQASEYKSAFKRLGDEYGPLDVSDIDSGAELIASAALG